MDKILEIENLKVNINNTSILDFNEKVSIYNKDVIGIIGENGAGKTTLINAIIEEVLYTGSIIRHFNREQLGIQFQENHYNGLMKVYEIIQIVTGQVKFDKNILNMINQYELEDCLKKRIGELSGGELQRLTVFLVMSNNPSLFIFDELTTGLDFKKRKKLLDIVKNKTENKTVLIVTHYFEELANWANKLLVLKKGEIAFFGEIQTLSEKFPHHSMLKIEKDTLAQLDLGEEILIDLDDEHVGIVISSLEKQEELIRQLGKKGISYEVQQRSIYTYYNIVMNEN